MYSKSEADKKKYLSNNDLFTNYVYKVLHNRFQYKNHNNFNVDS